MLVQNLMTWVQSLEPTVIEGQKLILGSSLTSFHMCDAHVHMQKIGQINVCYQINKLEVKG